MCCLPMQRHPAVQCLISQNCPSHDQSELMYYTFDGVVTVRLALFVSIRARWPNTIFSNLLYFSVLYFGGFRVNFEVTNLILKPSPGSRCEMLSCYIYLFIFFFHFEDWLLGNHSRRHRGRHHEMFGTFLLGRFPFEGQGTQNEGSKQDWKSDCSQWKLLQVWRLVSTSVGQNETGTGSRGT